MVTASEKTPPARRRRFRLRERSRRLGPAPLWCHGTGTRKHDDERSQLTGLNKTRPLSPSPGSWFRPCCSSNKTAAGRPDMPGRRTQG